MGVDIRTMHGHDVVVDICSSYNLIARKSLPLLWEQCIVKNSNLPSLAGVDESLWSLSGVVSLVIRSWNTAYGAHFVIAARLAFIALVELGF